MEIKIFKCGLCKIEKRKPLTRKEFRKHLEEEHRIMTNKFNRTGEHGKEKQNWVIEE